MVTEETRNRIVDALMELAAEGPYADVTLMAIAERAGVSLATLREAFDGRLAMLREFARRIDRQVLEGSGETTEESPRDRLFEVIMRRFDVLAPYKAGLKSIAAAARRQPSLALALGAIGLASQPWMLAAADIGATGPRGAVKAQGLALVQAGAAAVWLEDEDSDLGRTMAALDKGLRRGERALARLDRAAACLCRPLEALSAWRCGRRPEAEADEAPEQAA
jgi:AcrR family transcriptional regulator